MFDRELKVYAFLLGYGRSLLADIDDERMAEQPTPGMNPPAWQVGHLALVADLGLGLLGEPTRLPQAWAADFGPGSSPRSDRSSYPSKAELVAAWEAGHERFSQAVRRVDPARLDQPHPVKMAPLRRALPTVGDLLAHLLTSHEASHFGQLSGWRRQVGLPYLF